MTTYEAFQELHEALLDVRYALLREAWPLVRVIMRVLDRAVGRAQ